MRIWDLPPGMLCRNHLLGEHRELHAIWSIINEKKQGYRHHPETLRWQGKLLALYLRHEQLVEEMTKRGYHHRSPLRKKQATGKKVQDVLLDSIPKQKRLLREKHCGCRV